MPASNTSLAHLRAHVAELEEDFPHHAPDDLFLIWFLYAYLVEDITIADAAVSGAPNDKGIDAVLIDDRARRAFVIQGKYHQSSSKLEKRPDVISFAELSRVFGADKAAFGEFAVGLDPNVETKVKEVRERLRRRDQYGLQLFYVTTGRCAAGLQTEAENTARRGSPRTEFEVIDGDRLLAIFDDYRRGVAPPVRSLDLPIDIGGKAHSGGVISRYDPISEIESWVFSMTGGDLAKLYRQTGVRLFARNIRGFLGKTEINRAMDNTLEAQPEHFWYFNNGVTLVCDNARRIEQHGREILRVENPQVINGQQTTRVLEASDAKTSKASVLVRVIRIPRGKQDSNGQFEQLVSRIVEATNWQNAIKASDLMANDRQQVFIERELRKVGYQYLRKRQTRTEARRVAGRKLKMVTKEAMAQAVAACELDPAVVRAGKEGLFEERYYPTVFGSADPDFYLNRYWLMRHVTLSAKGFPERAYAKWLVLHFVWDELGRDISRHALRFRQASESPSRHSQIIQPLDSAINRAFISALQFYRANRGTGARALDISSFFKRRQLDRDFRAYWKRQAPGIRGKFDRAANRFQDRLKA
ncbi:MAG: AIPR family protein [Actinomycetota bacterium]